MQNEELIKALKEDAEWAHANEYEVPINLGDTLREAAEELTEMLRFLPHNCGTCVHYNKECIISGPECRWEWRGCTRSGAKHIEIEGVIPDGEDTDGQ